MKRTRTATLLSKSKVARIVDETTKMRPAQGEFKLSFAPGRYVVYTQYNNQTQIHVREYETKTLLNGDHHEYPTKKGVCLTPQRLKVLRNKIVEIDENLNQRNENTVYKTHLGAGIQASVDKFNGVDLRRYWIPQGQPSIVPTKSGIYLPAVQWKSLKEKLNELVSAHPELDDVEECFHQNQMEIYDCHECQPFGYPIYQI